MKKWSLNDFIAPFLTGVIPMAVYFFLQKEDPVLVRLIDSLFLGGLIPFIIGSWRLVCAVGSFDLFVYSNKKIWGRRKRKQDSLEDPTEENLKKDTRFAGSYHDYVLQKGPAKPYGAYMLSGFAFIALSLLLTFVVY